MFLALAWHPALGSILGNRNICTRQPGQWSSLPSIPMIFQSIGPSQTQGLQLGGRQRNLKVLVPTVVAMLQIAGQRMMWYNVQTIGTMLIPLKCVVCLGLFCFFQQDDHDVLPHVFAQSRRSSVEPVFEDFRKIHEVCFIECNDHIRSYGIVCASFSLPEFLFLFCCGPSP